MLHDHMLLQLGYGFEFDRNQVFIIPNIVPDHHPQNGSIYIYTFRFQGDIKHQVAMHRYLHRIDETQTRAAEVIQFHNRGWP